MVTGGLITKADRAEAKSRAEMWAERIQREQLGPGHGEARQRPMALQVVGALGEIIYAKHYGLPLPDDDEFGDGDFGYIQVRTTAHIDGHLIVFTREPIDRLFVLVVIDEATDTYRIAGEIDGRDVFGWGEDPGSRVREGSPPQLWVHQKHLIPHRGPRHDTGR